MQFILVQLFNHSSKIVVSKFIRNKISLGISRKTVEFSLTLEAYCHQNLTIFILLFCVKLPCLNAGLNPLLNTTPTYKVFAYVDLY